VAADAGAVALVEPAGGRRISLPGTFTELREVVAGGGSEGAGATDGRRISE